MASADTMQDMGDEQGAAVDETTEQPVKPEKPRGKCTGCAFEYQLGTARTGEHKGKQVIRKHNSRTGPGLCSGAQQPPEPTYEELEGANISQHGEDLTAAYSPQEDPTCEQCEDDPDYCSSAPHEDVVGVAPGGMPIVATPENLQRQPVTRGVIPLNPDPWTAPGGMPIVATPLDADGKPVGEPFDAVGAITLCPSPVDPWSAPAPAADPHEREATAAIAAVAADDRRAEAEYEAVIRDAVQATLPPHTVLAPDAQVTVTGVPLNIPVSIAPDPWSAPAAASDIPESTTTVSGQPEPDRDRWGRYLIMGTAHTRATTFAKLGANTKAIEAWNERNVIRGLTLRPDLLMLANGLEVKRDRNDLNSIAAQAKDAAGSKVAANIGTAYHAFSERLDAGLIALSHVPEQYRHRLRQYDEAITRASLTTRPEWIERTTAVRADQIGAPLPVAGTLDRIFQLPDGSLVIGDLKTGSDLSYGEMEIEVQLALYAHGANTHGLFDWNTKTWEDVYSETGVRVRTDIAIVVHLPADGDGCTLYVADIERGWRDAQRLGPLQGSLKEKKRFRALMMTDLHGPLPVPESGTELHRALHPATVAAPPDSHWELAKELISTAQDQLAVSTIYQYAMDSGKFHQDQLAVLVGLGKDRLNALAKRG